MKISLIGFLFLGVFFVSGCSKNNRTGFYYPNADNIGNEKSWEIKEELKSLDECRNWIDSIKGNNTNYDYECGYKCKYKNDYGITICKKTEK